MWHLVNKVLPIHEGQHKKATDVENSAGPTLILRALPVPSCVSPTRWFFLSGFSLLDQTENTFRGLWLCFVKDVEMSLYLGRSGNFCRDVLGWSCDSCHACREIPSWEWAALAPATCLGRASQKVVSYPILYQQT